MFSRYSLITAVLCIGIHAQSINILTPVEDPSPLPAASGKPTTPTITVTAVVTSIAIETSFVNVTVKVTETEIDLQTAFVTGFVTDFVTNLVTDIATQVITNVETLPALTETEFVTNVKTLPAPTETEKITLPAVTIHSTATLALTVTATKVVTETPPAASLCPGGDEEIFEATHGIFIIVCGQSRPTFDLIPGGQTTNSVYACADLCDGLTAAGVQCSAGMFEASSSTCFPQGVDDSSSITPSQGFDTAVLNTTAVANSLNETKMVKRSSWLF